MSSRALRAPQPDDCFKETQFGNIKIRVLKPVDDEGRVISADARRLMAWQESAFDVSDLSFRVRRGEQ